MNIPDINLLDFDRNEVNLKSYEGEKIIIAFFPGAFTGVCTEELCSLQSDLDQFKKLNIQIVGISVDSPFALNGWAQANNITFDLLSDYKKECIKLFDVEFHGLAGMDGYVSSNRAVFIADSSGEITYKWIAENPGVLPDFEEIKNNL
ncbi:MAG: redoxin domain-containing protein [Dehalococcoidales bacterium]|jgi:glutaredoxin-dependent peroxiredoxin|nr:redoxin domain-containing protein [Dehalococcoidales bacterium]